jgi:hypothetical protein
MLIVTQKFVGHGYDMPVLGTLIDPPEHVAKELVAIGVAAYFETKIMPLPPETKKKELSGS